MAQTTWNLWLSANTHQGQTYCWSNVTFLDSENSVSVQPSCISFNLILGCRDCDAYHIHRLQDILDIRSCHLPALRMAAPLLKL
jgi:hypothetical protein